MPVRWWNDTQVILVAREAGLEAIKEYSEGIMRSSREKTPMNKDPKMAWHKGTLRYSGVSDHTPDGTVLRYSVNEPFDYALLQHDTKWFRHETGEHSFLSNPVKNMAGEGRNLKVQYKRFIQTRVRDALRRTP